jgi:O-antigen/teichoic acid export membrane protein
MTGQTTRAQREYGRSTALLTAAIGTSGVLTYLFFVLASHALEPDDYGKVVVLWSVMFVGLSILSRPVELLLSRSIASLHARKEPAKHAIRVAARIQAGVLVAFIGLAFIFREPIERDVFDGDSIYFWSLVASTLGFGASFFARGVLAGERRFATFSAVVLADTVVRTVFALTVAVGILDGPDPFVLGIALAPAISVAAWPLVNAVVRRRGHGTPEGAAAQEPLDPNFTLIEGSGLALGILLVMAGEQVLLNGGPLLARAELDAAAAGFIFNVLLIARAPVVLFQAAASALLPHLTGIKDSGAVESERAFRQSVQVTLAAIAGFGAVTFLAILAVGPSVMEIAFGQRFEYPRSDLLIVAIGMPFYLGATTLTQAGLARGNVRAVAGSWVGTAACLLGWYLLSDLEVTRTIELGFAGSSVLLFTLLWVVYQARGR